MITETITFHFDDAEQQRRFHERLNLSDRYVLVPREPTEAMCVAGEECDGNSGPGPWLDGGHKPENVERIYTAMIEAAPSFTLPAAEVVNFRRKA
jgi:hypothetical protein